MSKGKKYTAAEKHFQNIIDARNKTIKRLEISNNNLFEENKKLTEANNKLTNELSYYKSVTEELQKLHNMSDDDIKSLIDKTVHDNATKEMFTNLLNAYFKGV